MSLSEVQLTALGHQRHNGISLITKQNIPRNGVGVNNVGTFFYFYFYEREKPMERTYIFDPTEFERARANYYHVSVSDTWVKLLTELSEHFKGVDVQTGQFSLGIPAGIGTEYFQWDRKERREAIEIVLPSTVAIKLNDFYYAIAARLREEYEIGLSDGTNLLKRLSSGEITVADVDAVKRQDD